MYYNSCILINFVYFPGFWLQQTEPWEQKSQLRTCIPNWRVSILWSIFVPTVFSLFVKTTCLKSPGLEILSHSFFHSSPVTQQKVYGWALIYWYYIGFKLQRDWNTFPLLSNKLTLYLKIFTIYDFCSPSNVFTKYFPVYFFLFSTQNLLTIHFSLCLSGGINGIHWSIWTLFTS